MVAFYHNTIAQFINDEDQLIIGTLSTSSGLAGFYQLLHTQTLSWGEEIAILKRAFKAAIKINPKIAQFGVLLEYPIARREKRIDIIITCGSLIIVIEFKAGRNEYLNNDKEQLLDYCLDLRDFHYESRGINIVPILLASNAPSFDNQYYGNDETVKDISFANSEDLSGVLLNVIRNYDDGYSVLNLQKWNESDYSPTPTIIEAAQALYAGKSVIEISRSHAGTKNLTRTSNTVIRAIKKAKENNQKIICFITGVPGAGKTLAGLNIAHDEEFQDKQQSMVTFLSGNGPLIKVLKESLARDAHKRTKKSDANAKKRESDRIISFIENVHQFLDHYFFEKTKIPNNKIVIFDEAQRAWNAEHSMRKFKRPHSEAEMMFEIMNRHTDWSAIVALVGGGQEINTGEAGLREWGRMLTEKFSDWQVHISPKLKTGNHSTGNLTLFGQTPSNMTIVENEDLHLDVSIRSYKAEQLSNWVNLVLTNNGFGAKQILEEKLKNYKIYITRNLDQAKLWLKAECKGSRRMGLVASSGARRLRPYGLDVKIELEEAAWFLNPKSDVRSSYYLEIPATEFGIQGLELDWVGVCWDADLRRKNGEWDFNTFKGTKWQKVNNIENKQFILNKYRVLLTRAREGMIIFVPEGDVNDPTRCPQYYNSIADYLVSCGVKNI